MYIVQSLGLRYIQSAGFREELCTECRVQACATYRVQSCGLLYIQSAAFRGALCTKCSVTGALRTEGRDQECSVNRVQGKRCFTYKV